MTFYKLLGSRTLSDREEKADYLESDLQWIRDSTENVLDISYIEDSFDSSVDKIRSGRELTEDEARLVGAVFLGDGEFLNLNRDWFTHRPVRFLLGFGDAAAHHKYQRIAKEFYDLSELRMPAYSTPDDYRIRDEPVIEHTDSFIQRAVLASTVTSLDWLEYILREMEVEYSEDYLDLTRSQMAKFLSGESGDLESEVAEFQVRMFGANVSWTQDLEQKFEFNSRLADRVCDEMDRIRENRLENQI